ncbi:long-chain fatty acid transport protein 6-like [Acanthaster planci]|uniref:long-chain-fatty-acid--CoA ligase n=1 Tax=Acanthaster planci TaxID=133434 RepID=A0A8B7ZZ59_ACAPL|nr:long-chain fatty acid transport protein 6-like [Acanthaster planci]XP_022110809.1 long-chain fatty acid transport protein 6-like [Acanthaster planci]
MSDTPINRRLLGAAAAIIAGLPVAVAGFLRLKYGRTVFADLVAFQKEQQQKKEVEALVEQNFKVIDFFEAHVKQTPDKEFVLHKDELLTYGELDRQANQLAHFVQQSEVAACMETVAIFIRNEPSFVVSWLAFAKLGLRIALINYNLKGRGLLYSIKACNVKMIACGNDKRLVQALADLMPELQAFGVKVWVVGKDLDEGLPLGMIPVDVKTLKERSDPIPRSVRDQQPVLDDSLYIFTSGTTGFPKAARVPHTRQLSGSFFQAALGLTKDDVVYVCLPLYHSMGFTVGLQNVIRVGGTVVISDFSAQRFWDEVRRYRATVILYIGETCRYLMAQQQRVDDGKYDHKVRYAVGLGLSSDIWEEFQKRFNIGRIVEFYGATDGTHTTTNLEGKLGSVGRYPLVYKVLQNAIVLVQCDIETAQPLRSPNGKCILTPPGEMGLMLFRLVDVSHFHGYVSEASTLKKLVRDVKKNGDLFFNTGDLMVQDKDGYLYFKDRLGDTFRWKSENVATREVAHVLNQYSGIQESNVYGVKVPGCDGRAGMAAVVFKEGHQLDPKAFFDHVFRSLPLFACPKFLRIIKKMDITGTFKHKKTNLAREGFDPNVISDPLFFVDDEKKTYAPLDKETFQKILVGKAKL